VYPEPWSYVRLPTYCWQRGDYWSETRAARADRVKNVEHPLLGARVPAATPTWESDLNANYLPYLADHVVDGVPILPATAYIEAGLAMHAATTGTERASLEDLEFTRAMIEEEARDPRVQWTYEPDSGEYRAFGTAGLDGTGWTLQASGRVSSAAPGAVPRVDLQKIRARCPESVAPADLYARLRAHGLQYGPWFQGVRELARGSGESLAVMLTFASGVE